jgi:hypothetical protein
MKVRFVFGEPSRALISEEADTRMKTMKPNFKTFPHFQDLARTFLAAVAVLALSRAHAMPGVVDATYTTGAEVPVRSNGFTATGKTINFTLNYAPATGTQLMVVQNAGHDIIRGTFSNLAQGQRVALSYGGVTYNFVANYYGGKGNDLVLLWASGDESLPAATMTKLDAQIELALKKSRGEPPFDKPTSLEPDIPIKDPGRILVQIDATVSKELLEQIVLIGGQVWSSAESSHTICAMVPLAHIEALAARPEIKSIAPARLYDTSEAKGSESGIPAATPKFNR